MQQTALIQIPHFGPVTGLQKLRRKAAEEIPQVIHVAQQHALRMVVAGCVHRLWQVNDDWPVGGQQDVELRQVAVHGACAQHAHHLYQQRGMVRARLFGCQRHVVKAGRGVAMFIGHQFHQQHAIVKVVRLGHAHAGFGQAIQSVDLGALPRGLLRLSAELGALGHSARLARILDLAVLGVVDRLAKATLRGLFVNFGAARFVAAAHDEHHRLLATHELAHDGVDQAFFD